MQVRNVNIARENRGLAQNKPRVVESVHVMNPHISGKVVKMARLEKEQRGLAAGLTNAGIRQAELSVIFTFFRVRYLYYKITTHLYSVLVENIQNKSITCFLF